MISRTLLIIHDSRVIRSLVKGFILAELDDITPLEASSGKEALQMVEQGKIDIILSAYFLKDCEGHELHSKLKATEMGSEIPFIVFTSTATDEHIDEIRQRGIQHHLVAPFSSVTLRKKIDEVFDPRQLRGQQRYSIPGTQAVIHLESQNITADVINLSISSAFCEFTLPADASDLLGSMYLSINFPAEYEGVMISDLYCKLLSVKTISWHPNDVPEKVRVVWLFKNLSQRNESIFSDVLDRAEKRIESIQNIY